MSTNGIALDALGDWTRRQILEALKQGPLSVGALAARLPVSRPAVSQHLRVLKDAGLVHDRKEGTKRVYSVDPNGPRRHPRVLRQLLGRGARSLRRRGEKGDRMSTTATDAIRKTVLVDFAPAEAFELFTDRIASWWPVGTHSYGGEDVTDVVLEPGVGGRLYEVTAAGRAGLGPRPRVGAAEPVPPRLADRPGQRHRGRGALPAGRAGNARRARAPRLRRRRAAARTTSVAGTSCSRPSSSRRRPRRRRRAAPRAARLVRAWPGARGAAAARRAPRTRGARAASTSAPPQRTPPSAARA